MRTTKDSVQTLFEGFIFIFGLVNEIFHWLGLIFEIFKDLDKLDLDKIEPQWLRSSF